MSFLLRITGLVLLGWTIVQLGAEGNGDGVFWTIAFVVALVFTMAVWIPWVARSISGEVVSTEVVGQGGGTGDQFSVRVNRLAAKGRRSWAVYLCFIRGLNRFNNPQPFVLGMRLARDGSWVKRAFAKEYLKFEGGRFREEAESIIQSKAGS